MNVRHLLPSLAFLHRTTATAPVLVDAETAQSIPAAGAVLAAAAVDPAVIDLRPVKAEPGSVLAKAWASVQKRRAASPPAAVGAEPAVAPAAPVAALGAAVVPVPAMKEGASPAPSPMVRDLTAALSRKELSGKPALLEMVANSADPKERQTLLEMVKAMDAGMPPEEFVARAKVREQLQAVIDTSADKAERWSACEAMEAVMDRSIPLASIQLPANTARRRAELESLLASPDNAVRWDACLALDALDRGEAPPPFHFHAVKAEKCPSCGAVEAETRECSVCEETCCPECSTESDDGSVTCRDCNDKLGTRNDDEESKDAARVEAHLNALTTFAVGNQLRWDIACAITRVEAGENVEALAVELTRATLEERISATADAAEKSKLTVELAALTSAGMLPRATAAEIAAVQAEFDRADSAHSKMILGLRLHGLKLNAA
jgi:hypothetical protein